MKRASLLHALALSALALAPALLGAACTNDDVSIGQDQQKSCSTDSDCAGGELCVSGACAPAGCNADSDCPSGEACVNGACAPAGCVPQAEQCDGIDNDCNGIVDDGATCFFGVCSNGACTTECATDADCPNQQACVNGACGAGPCNPVAEVCDGIDNDCDGIVDNGATCPGNQTCSAGQCQSACATDADCPIGLLCVNGACISNSNCQPAAEICDGIDNDCNGIVDDGATCFVGSCTNGACVAECAADSDCLSQEVCLNGVCTPTT